MDQEKKETRPVTKEDVEALQNILRSDASIQTKAERVDAIKSSIKKHNLDIPGDCITQLFEAFRVASSNQHSALAKSGLSALKHYHTRLYLQKLPLANSAKHEMKKNTLPLLIDKIGDPRKEVRPPAVQALATMYKILPTEVEEHVRDAMVNKKPAAKEASMQWLVQMNREQGLKFKDYVKSFVPLVGAAEPEVRQTAKVTIIELFRDAPPVAKSELWTELAKVNVQSLIRREIDQALAPRSTTTPAPDESAPADLPRPASRPGLSASVSSMSTFSERPITPMPDTRTETVEPSYLNTTREIDDMFTQMHGYFDGVEHEHNWRLREQSTNKLRRLMAGNAVSDFHDPFLAGLRGLLDGIIKAVNSLRTSLSKEGCALVRDIAVNYGPGMDPMVELLMQSLIKLCGATKKIAVHDASVSIQTIIERVTFTNRILTHVTSTCADPNEQRRVCAAEWLTTLLKLLEKEAHHKSHVEHNGGLALIENSIKKGLSDGRAPVREKMRATYWTFHGVWPARAELLFKDFGSKLQEQLENHPSNPNFVARPGMGHSRSTTGAAPRSSIVKTLKAQQRQNAAQKLPVRPGSAMAHFSPPRPTRAVSGSGSTSASTAAASSATRQKPTTSGGLSVAPVRPTKKRPQMAPRPATAGPYSVRGGLDTEMSPPPKPKAVTPKTMGTTPKRTVAKARPAHKPTASESSIPTPTRLTHAKSSPATSPTKSPTRQILQPGPLLGSPQPEDNLSLITPTTPTISGPNTPALASPDLVAPEPAAAEPDQSGSPVGTPSRALRVYEDPLTAEQSTPRLTPPAVLEEKAVNEDAANLMARQNGDGSDQPDISDKAKQHARLIESALAKIKAKTLDVHGFRKLQSILRDNKAPLSDDKFEALLLGLFDYLEDPQSNLAPEKVQDVKAQNLATVKLLLKKYRDHFQPHISKGLESLMSARAVYDARTHIVSGLELLADELVSLGDAQEIATVLTRRMTDTALDSAAGRRSLSMGLHVLKEMVDAKAEYVPTDQEVGSMAALCTRCLESTESGVRMDAVQLCVALQGRVGDARFWDVMKDVKDDPKSLITYYIVKRQREQEAASGVA